MTHAGWRLVNDQPPPVATSAPLDPPGPTREPSALPDARAAYRQATLRLHDARLRSSLTRRDVDATARQIRDANTAALDARRAWEDARDALVVAALEEEG